MKMTVEQLIEQLQQIEDKSKEVWALNADCEMRRDIAIHIFSNSIEIFASD